VDSREGICTCLDFAERGGHGRLHRCKHICAAIYVMRLPDGSTVVVQEKKRLNYPRPSLPAHQLAVDLIQRISSSSRRSHAGGQFEADIGGLLFAAQNVAGPRF
jgi:hypothetical protein